VDRHICVDDAYTAITVYTKSFTAIAVCKTFENRIYLAV